MTYYAKNNNVSNEQLERAGECEGNEARFCANDKPIYVILLNNCWLDAMNWICQQLWWEYANWFQIALFFHQISSYYFPHQPNQRLISWLNFFGLEFCFLNLKKRAEEKINQWPVTEKRKTTWHQSSMSSINSPSLPFSIAFFNQKSQIKPIILLDIEIEHKLSNTHKSSSSTAFAIVLIQKKRTQLSFPFR